MTCGVSIAHKWLTHRKETHQGGYGDDSHRFHASLTGERSLAKYTGGRERPSRDEIARLAYQFYEIRGRRHDHDVDDWLSAERELTQHYR